MFETLGALPRFIQDNTERTRLVAPLASMWGGDLVEPFRPSWLQGRARRAAPGVRRATIARPFSLRDVAKVRKNAHESKLGGERRPEKLTFSSGT